MWLIAALPLLGSPPRDATPGIDAFDPPQRALWSRGSERFQRQWLVAGPVAPQAIDRLEPGTLQPAAGQPLVADGPRWMPHASWGDVVDLAGMLGGAQNPEEARYAFAAASISRAHAGAAELAVGIEGTATIWVNGRQVHQATVERFMPDGLRIPVRLQAGENRVLMRLRKAGAGTWRYALRVVEPGTVLPRSEEIAPFLVPGGDALTLRTDVTEDPRGAPVEIEAIAAGGRVVARASAARGATVRLDPSAWEDGAYELRATTRDAWGNRRVAHLPWYKGDAIAAAQRLLDDARTAEDEPRAGTLRMLAELVAARAGARLEHAHPDMWAGLHPALMEYEELALEAAGQQGSVRAGGFVRLAYVDDVDGSVQFCRAYLPLDYAGTQRWPLIAALHGFNPGNPRYHAWWSADRRHSDVADRLDTIVVEPHGRGNAQYVGIGENDVLRCLDEAKRRFSVDEDRVYLTGDSMGGNGTWRIASRHPHLFAAAAPVFGGWDFRLGPPDATAPPPAVDNARDAFFMEMRGSFANAEGLLNVPMLVLHGDDDAAVSVEHSRHAVRMLQRWGYDIHYHEMPGWGHEDLLAAERVAAWLLRHRRNPAPRLVRLRAVDLAAARAHWVTVHAFEAPLRVVRVEAEVMRPGVVRLDTDNATEVALALPAELRGTRDALEVTWNGVRHDVKLRDGIAELRSAPVGGRPALRKRAGVEGPLPDILRTPFVIVVGTIADDPQMRRYCRENAEALRAVWQRWQHQSPRVVRDVDLDPEDERRYSLILIGGADANAVARRLAARLPVRISGETVTIDGRSWTAADAVLQMIYPSPVAADRYVLLVAATSATGMYAWRPALVQPVVGYPLVWWDWTLRDARWPPAGEPYVADDAFIAAGTFDAGWRRDDRWTIEGDAQRRANWKVRRAPPPEFTPSAAALAANAGRYELFPGFVGTIGNEGGSLVWRVPGEPEVELIAEGDRMYRHPLTGGAVEFVHDGQGRVTAMEIELDDGPTLSARRLP